MTYISALHRSGKVFYSTQYIVLYDYPPVLPCHTMQFSWYKETVQCCILALLTSDHLAAAGMQAEEKRIAEPHAPAQAPYPSLSPHVTLSPNPKLGPWEVYPQSI